MNKESIGMVLRESVEVAGQDSSSAKSRAELSRRLLLIGPMGTILPGIVMDQAAAAASSDFPSRTVPARSLTVPDTVSPVLQTFIAAPYPPGWDLIPQTVSAWKELASQSAAAAAPDIAAIRQRLHVKVDPSVIAGVPV